jgi:hypothetical protein
MSSETAHNRLHFIVSHVAGTFIGRVNYRPGTDPLVAAKHAWGHDAFYQECNPPRPFTYSPYRIIDCYAEGVETIPRG